MLNMNNAKEALKPYEVRGKNQNPQPKYKTSALRQALKMTSMYKRTTR